MESRSNASPWSYILASVAVGEPIITSCVRLIAVGLGNARRASGCAGRKKLFMSPAVCRGREPRRVLIMIRRLRAVRTQAHPVALRIIGITQQDVMDATTFSQRS